MPTVKVSFYGDVQGVGFRFFVREYAVRHNIKGNVKNVAGYVEAIFEGEQRNINKMMELISKSYMASKIRSVKQEPAITKNFTDFKILAEEPSF